MNINKIIIIEWFTHQNHKNFNKNFLKVLKLDKKLIYKFHLKNRGLYERFKLYRKINSFLKKKNDKIFLFLTYDKLFISLINIIHKKIICIEHNTAPKKILSLDSIYQFIFLKKILRLALYNEQKIILNKIFQNVHLLGAPLETKKKQKNKNFDKFEKKIILIPSPLNNLNFLNKKKEYFNGFQIWINNKSKNQVDTEGSDYFFYDWINLNNYKDRIACIIVDKISLYRGSGWYLEAIDNNVPLVVISEYNYINLKKSFKNFNFFCLDNNNKRDFIKYIKSTPYKNVDRVNHNNLIYKNFYTFIKNIN